MSLRLQLLAAIAVVLTGTLLLGAALTYWHAQHKIATEMHAAIAVGSRIAHNAVDDAEEVTNPARRLELLVRDFDGDRHLRAYLVEPDGTVSVVSRLAEPEEPPPAWLADLIGFKPLSVMLPLPSVFANHGNVRLETDAANEIGEVWQDVQLYLTILATFCAAGLAAAFLVVGRALAPLVRQIAAFEDIGRGDYGVHLKPDGPRELRSLATGFNHMVERLAETERRNKALLAQLGAVEEEERVELARNLHDEVSPLLFCIDVDARSIENLTAGGDATAINQHARAIQQSVKSVKGNVRSILGNLRSGSLQALGLHGTVEELVEFWRARHPGVTFEIDLPEASWGPRVDSTLQAIITEAVSNAMKHAQPSRVTVRLREEGGMVNLTITDNGVGFQRRQAPSSGFGIVGMKERAATCAGSLTVGARADGRGVIVRASIPILSAPGNDTDPVDLQAQAS